MCKVMFLLEKSFARVKCCVWLEQNGSWDGSQLREVPQGEISVSVSGSEIHCTVLELCAPSR